MDFAMPFMIQTMREFSTRIEKLEESEKIRSAEDRSQEQKPIVFGKFNCFKLNFVLILILFKLLLEPQPQLMLTAGPAFIPPFAQQPAAFGYSPQPPQFNAYNPY